MELIDRSGILHIGLLLHTLGLLPVYQYYGKTPLLQCSKQGLPITSCRFHGDMFYLFLLQPLDQLLMIFGVYSKFLNITGCFLPDEQTNNVRTYYRHRSKLVEESSGLSNRMQQAMRLMNIRLDNILNDIMRASGRRIIEVLKGYEQMME